MSYSRLSLFGFLFIFVSDLTIRINVFGGESNGSTLVIAVSNIIAALALILLVREFRLIDSVPSFGRLCFLACIFWGLVSLIYGAITADDYWSWKSLVLTHFFVILIPLSLIVGVHVQLFLVVFRFICFVILPLGLLIVPYALVDDIQLVPRVVAPIMLLLLFSFYVSLRWRIFFLIVALVSIGVDFSYRTNLIRFLVSVGLVGLVALKFRWPFRIWPLIVGALFSIPLILLVLGITDEFNIFRDNTFSYDVISRKDKVVDVTEFNADTRTFLYYEVFTSMLNRGSSFLLGEGGASGYETIWFLDADLNGKGRYASEVGFLNILLHQGAIGVVIYGAMLIVSCVTALRHSNNELCRILGFFLMARWVLLFIEETPAFDVLNYINWVAMGLCLSNNFRALTDDQLRIKFTDALKSPFTRK